MIIKNKVLTRKSILSVILIAAILRLGLLSYLFIRGIPVASGIDQFEYLQIAHNVVEGYGYSICIDLDGHGIPYRENAIHSTAWRLPGYPLVLAAILKLGLPAWLISVTQIIIDLISLWIILHLPILSKIRRATAILYALSPQNVLFSSLILPETFLTFFLLLGFYLLVKAIMEQNHKIIWSALAGMAFGFASLFHAYVLFLPVVILTIILWKRRWSIAFVLLLFYILILTPWILRNYFVFHGPIYASNISTNLAFFKVPYLYAPLSMPEYIKVKQQLFHQYQEEINNLGLDGKVFEVNSPVVSRLGRKWFIEAIEDRPLRLLQATTISTIRLIFIGHSDYGIVFNWPSLSPKLLQGGWAKFLNWLREPIIWIELFLDAITTLLAILASIGFYVLMKKSNHKCLSLLLGLIIIYAVVVFSPAGIARYRASLNPFLFILGAHGFYHFYEKLKYKQLIKQPFQGLLKLP